MYDITGTARYQKDSSDILAFDFLLCPFIYSSFCIVIIINILRPNNKSPFFEKGF